MRPTPLLLMRLFASGQGLVGAWLIAAPSGVAAAAGGQAGGAPPTWSVQLLGTRMLLQGIAQVTHPGQRAMAVGTGTDLVHAASMVGVAAAWPRFRRAASASAVVAVVSATLEAALLSMRR